MAEFSHNFSKHQLTFSLNLDITTTAFSSNGKILVTGGRKDLTIKVWDSQSGQLINSWLTSSFKPYSLTNEIAAAAISADGKTLVTGGSILQTWELDTGKQIRIFKSSGWTSYINLSADSQTLITEGSLGMIIWNLQSGKKIRRNLKEFTVRWVISPNSRTIVGEDSFDDKIKVWDLTSGKEIRVLDNSHAIAVRKLSLSQDGKLLAGSGYDGIKIWDFETGEQIQRIEKFKNVQFHEHLDCVGNAIFNFDNQTLLSSGSDGLIQMWDVNTGKNVATLRGENYIFDIEMSHDGQILIGFGKNLQNQLTIDVWNTD